ncbi:MAG: YceD family protein [Gammaproteobacteria bacterium]
MNLQFGLDAEGRKLLTGSIAASLELVCQRCLKGMQQSVVSELSVLVFANQAELEQQMSAQAQESLEQDVLLLDEIQSSEAASTKSPDKTPEKSDQELDVIAVVEDELILSLPLAPMHEDIDCSKVWTQIRDQEPQEDGQGLDSVGNSPFAMLAKLKKDNT